MIIIGIVIGIAHTAIMEGDPITVDITVPGTIMAIITHTTEAIIHMDIHHGTIHMIIMDMEDTEGDMVITQIIGVHTVARIIINMVIEIAGLQMDQA